ncbi:MAG: NUDIX hydrolase [Patescibacteria group bacterium]
MSGNNFKEKLESAISAGHNIGACIRVQWQDRFLLLKRSATDSCSGILEIPGGSVDESEELTHAAVRELFEEAGIVVLPEKLQPLGIFEFHNIETNKHKTKFAFTIELDKEPEIQLSPDHDELIFLTKGEINDLPREGRDKDYVLWEDHYRMLIA